MTSRILTFRVFARNIEGFSAARDSVYVRGDWDGFAPVQLFDATGTGIYSGNVVVPGDAGTEVGFKYFALVGEENLWEPDFDPDGSNRMYTLGPSDVPTFASRQPHIFGTLDPIAPQGVRTGEKAVFLPISQSSDADAPCHGWFFQNFVAWDGNSSIQETGVVFSSDRIDGPVDIEVYDLQPISPIDRVGGIIWQHRDGGPTKVMSGKYFRDGSRNGKPLYRSANGCIIAFDDTDEWVSRFGEEKKWFIAAEDIPTADPQFTILIAPDRHLNSDGSVIIENWEGNRHPPFSDPDPDLPGGNWRTYFLWNSEEYRANRGPLSRLPGSGLFREREWVVGIQALTSQNTSVGEFAAANPGAGYVFGGAAAGGLFPPSVIYYRAYAKNEAGISYGEQRQAIVPAGGLREWRGVYAEADFFAAEDSTAMQKGVALAWQEAQGATGEWEWEIHRFESSQVDQNPAQGHRILASFPDSEAVRNGTQRSYVDRSVFPGWSYLYLIGIRDSQGLWACRAAWVNISYWTQPSVPGFAAQSQTPYSLTFQV